MTLPAPQLESLRTMTRDVWLLFATRCLRLFGYGLLSVILVLYLVEVGITKADIGLLISLTLIGDTIVSLWITTTADRTGRRRMLMVGALLMFLAGAVFALTHNYWLLLAAATIGVISPSGNEVGPFLSIEQASLAQTIPHDRRTAVFAWYNLVGSFATATGALVGGGTVWLLKYLNWSPLDCFRVVIFIYAAIGLTLILLFLLVSPAVEIAKTDAKPSVPLLLGLHKSKRVVFKLSALFSLDAFAGGFVLQGFVAYWFIIKFPHQVNEATLGGIFFGANILAGISALAAVPLAKKIGLIQTMVYTHIPSNLLLILVPLMPNLPLAITMLLLRFSISQMDVPTRQSYTMAVVDPDERSAASGITAVARSAGASISPSLAGLLLAASPVSVLFNGIFYLGGGLKIVYDLLLYRSFKRSRPAEER